MPECNASVSRTESHLPAEDDTFRPGDPDATEKRMLTNRRRGDHVGHVVNL